MRTLLAAVVGFGLGWLVALVVERRGGTTESIVATGIVMSLVFTMVAIVVLEMISRPRAAGGLSAFKMPHPIQAVRRRFHMARRTSQVTKIAAKHGLGSALGMGRAPDLSGEDATRVGVQTRQAL